MEQMQNADSYEDNAAKNAMVERGTTRDVFILGLEMRHHDHFVLYTCTFMYVGGSLPRIYDHVESVRE